MKEEARSMSMDPEYVTWQINSCILELFLRRFLFEICTVLKILIRFSLIKHFFEQLRKIFQPFASVDTAQSGSYKGFPTVNKHFWLTSIQGLVSKQQPWDYNWIKVLVLVCCSSSSQHHHSIILKSHDKLGSIDKNVLKMENL